MDFADEARAVVRQRWPGALASLEEYVRVPNSSPLFDPEFLTNGLMDEALAVVTSWLDEELARVPGLSYTVERLADRTPLLFMELDASPGCEDVGTAVMYGHIDKQPPLDQALWASGLGPRTPVVRDGKLYGRGAADDGYSPFAAVLALEAIVTCARQHPRCVVIIECCEESGSPDLPAYLAHLADRIGQASLVICLDSTAMSYDSLWVTTNLRGLIIGNLSVSMLSNGVHSGSASGVVPSTFRVLRQLLSRIEDEKTGRVSLPGLNVDVSDTRLEEINAAVSAVGAAGVVDCFPFLPGACPALPPLVSVSATNGTGSGHGDGDAAAAKAGALPSGKPAGGLSHQQLVQLQLQRTWQPQIANIGVDGLPSLRDAGNVMRPTTSLKLSIRLPPTLSSDVAAKQVKAVLESDPPYGAHVRFDVTSASTGWDAPEMQPWLADAVHAASQATFGKQARFQGEGGSIPFMGMLADRFPQAQFLATGVLGPESNPHGPNEFLHLETVQRVAASVALVLVDMSQAPVRVK